jgi:ArsR family transcriptional regulator
MGLPVLRRPGERCCDLDARAALEPREVEDLASDLDLLANPVRLQLLAVLAASAGDVCVCDLQAVVPVKQPTVSHHLGVLRKAGLVDVERRGLWAYYNVRRDALAALRSRVVAGLGKLEVKQAGLPVLAGAGNGTDRLEEWE